MADEGLQGKNLGDVIAEGVACVGAGAVGFVEIGHDGASGVGGPGDLLEILDEFAAAGIDEEAILFDGVAQATVDAVDAIGGVLSNASEVGKCLEAKADKILGPAVIGKAPMANRPARALCTTNLVGSNLR